MERLWRRTWMLCVLLIISSTLTFAQSTKPSTNKGKKWRVAYLQGGAYQDYQSTLKAIILGLADLGWIEPVTIPPQDNIQDTDKLWQWMSTSIKSKYLEFVADAYWTADWDKEMRPKLRAKVVKRLNKKKDIDLVFALGTWAGQDMAKDDIKTPILVGSTSNPLSAKIIKSVEDSGRDHIHARIDPTRYQRQVELFHDIIGFQKLGLVYEDTVDGRSYAAVDQIESVAKERGFKIISCAASFDNPSKEEAEKNVLDCHTKLAPKIDALYITTNTGVRPHNTEKLMQPLYQHKVPTFAQSGSRYVKHGVLLSISKADFKYVGQFYAETIAKILNGTKPRALTQVFEDPPKIAINLAAAKKIGYDPPVDILGAADEIYQDIEKVAASE